MMVKVKCLFDCFFRLNAPQMEGVKVQPVGIELPKQLTFARNLKPTVDILASRIGV